MPGVSGRALGALLGITEGAVRKAKTTRLKAAVLPDGTFDVEKAKALYRANTDPTLQRPRPGAAPPVRHDESDTFTLPPANMPQPGGAMPDVNKARAIQILENAQITRIRRQKLAETLVDRTKNRHLVMALAQRHRDGFLSFNDKYHSSMASELGIDAHALWAVLDRYMRRHNEREIESIRIEAGL